MSISNPTFSPSQNIIDEADLVVDYFRCAARINPLTAVATYKQYQKLVHQIDKRALFISQQFLLMSSHEDFAKFLHSLNIKKEHGTTIQWTLSDDSEHLSRAKITTPQSL